MSDGAFKRVPSGFTQVYTVFGCKQDKMFPCVFFLLQAKTKQVYAQMWAALAQYLYGSSDTTYAVDDRLHLVDFESACYLSLAQQFPRHVITGCYFHWKHALFTNLKAHGLADDYMKHNRTRELFGLLAALAFLPVDDVLCGYRALKAYCSETWCILIPDISGKQLVFHVFCVLYVHSKSFCVLGGSSPYFICLARRCALNSYFCILWGSSPYFTCLACACTPKF